MYEDTAAEPLHLPPGLQLGRAVAPKCRFATLAPFQAACQAFVQRYTACLRHEDCLLAQRAAVAEAVARAVSGGSDGASTAVTEATLAMVQARTVCTLLGLQSCSLIW